MRPLGFQVGGGLGLGLALLACGFAAASASAQASQVAARGGSQEVPLSPEEEAILEGPGPVEVRPGPRPGTVRLSFPPHPGARAYAIERSGWDEGPWEEAASGTPTTWVLGGLKPKTHYCFRVAARKEQGWGPFGVPGCGQSR